MGTEKYSHKPYESIYEQLYQKEESRLRTEFGPDINIDHIGSSSVPNLGGKGLIDIYIASSKSQLDEIFQTLQTRFGYEFKADSGNNERMFFLKHQIEKNGIERIYHLHLSDKENIDYKKTIAFRDYLRLHPEEASRYDSVKKKASVLAMRSEDYHKQRIIYQQSKRNIIEEITKKSISWHNERNQEQLNKNKRINLRFH